jgi:hypothetical protein
MKTMASPVTEAEASPMPLNSSRQESVSPHELRELVGRFEGLDQMTEAAFLDLGGKVQFFHKQARAITAGASETLRLLDGDEDGNTVNQLQLLVERCSLWLNRASQQNDQIVDVLAGLDRWLVQLGLPLGGLRKVAKALQALRVTTRIEATKVHGRSAVVMSEELGQLTLMIQSKVIEIDDQVEKLGRLSRQALVQEQQIQTGLLRTADREIRSARKSLSRTLDQRIMTTNQTETLKAHSETITLAFGEMVAALQFQDITRQRLGHVQEALRESVAQLEEAASRGETAQTEAQAMIAGICHLQGEQLSKAVQEFQAAADRLTDNLQTMAHSAVNMAADTRTSNLTSTEEEARQTEVVASILRSITRCFEGIWNTHQSAGNAILEVCQAARDMDVLIDEIEYVGEEIQLLAMNAAVNAAHSSGAGSGGLEVIADNIQELSETAYDQAMTLARDCKNIAEQAEGLSEAGRAEGDHDQELQSLFDKSQTLLSSLKTNNTVLEQTISDVRNDAEELAEQIAAFVRHVDVQEQFVRQVAPLSDELYALSQLADESHPESGSLGDGTSFEALQGRYTMKSERQVHQRFVEKHAPVENMGDEAVDEDEPAVPNDHGLGDNIELF